MSEKKSTMVSIRIEELEEAKTLIHASLSPKVTYSHDISQMSKEAEEERNKSLSLLLGWILKYVPSK